MNRLYVVEPTPTLTGAAADHRLAVASRDVALFAQAIAAELKVGDVAAASESEVLPGAGSPVTPVGSRVRPRPGRASRAKAWSSPARRSRPRFTRSCI